MERPVSLLTPGEAMGIDPSLPRVQKHVVDNLGKGLGPQIGVEWAALQQQQKAENTCLFHMLDEQQKVVVEQVLMTQALANK